MDGRFARHWEGDTLVVSVKALNPATWFDQSGNHHSADLKVTERFTRTGPDTLSYEATMEDAKTYTRPWTIRLTLYRHTEPNARLLEYDATPTWSLKEARNSHEEDCTYLDHRTGRAAAVFLAPAAGQPPAAEKGGKGGGKGKAAPAGPNVRTVRIIRLRSWWVVPPKRTSDGKPDMSGFWTARIGRSIFNVQGAQGGIVDPPGQDVAVHARGGRQGERPEGEPHVR
ncbi:MAG: hypothetical protein WDO18_19165 [Acidobacteriota bacterium]